MAEAVRIELTTGSSPRSRFQVGVLVHAGLLPLKINKLVDRGLGFVIVFYLSLLCLPILQVYLDQ